MFKNKKTRLIAISLVVVLIVATVTIVVLMKTKSNTNSTNQPAKQTTQVTKSTADALKLDAMKILSTDPTKAKTILEQAKTQYQELKDNNGVSNVDSQLYLIEHSITNK